MKNKKHFTCIVGLDGSGKTTLSNSVIQTSTIKAKYLWLGSESILMKPIRFILKLFFYKKNDYVKSETNKSKIVNNFSFFKFIYIFFVICDYYIQYRYKLLFSGKNQLIIFDRYFYDVCVNLSLVLNWDKIKLIDFIRTYHKYFLIPDTKFFIVVDPEISMQRKDDIPDIQYLVKRKDLYSALADEFGFTVLSGIDEIKDNTKEIIKKIEEDIKKIKIHYIHSNNYDIGGADKCMYRLAKEISDKNFSTSVSLRLKTNILNNYSAAGIPVIIGNYIRPQYNRNILRILLFPYLTIKSFFYFICLFYKNNFDIIHVNDLYDFIPAFAGKILKKKVFFHVRMIRTTKIEKKIFAWLLNFLSTKIIFVSRATKDNYFPMFNKKAEVVYDWPGDKLIKQNNRKSKPEEFENFDIIVSMVGRLDPWKGQHIFLEIVKKIKLNGLGKVGFFLIGGSVKGKEDYANKILKGAENLSINCLGERNDIDVLLYYSDISVHTSTTPDPFPGVVLESLLSECVTVAANAGGVKEMIDNEINGFLIGPGNSDKYSEIILNLLNLNSEKRNEIAKKGRINILEKYNKHNIVLQFKELYMKI